MGVGGGGGGACSRSPRAGQISRKIEGNGSGRCDADAIMVVSMVDPRVSFFFFFFLLLVIVLVLVMNFLS